MAAAMRGLVQSPDLVSELGSAGRRFAATFTWDRAAGETLAHLEEVVGK
jgi:glycosyltransferase involved in cell wall biosynthesis